MKSKWFPLSAFVLPSEPSVLCLVLHVVENKSLRIKADTLDTLHPAALHTYLPGNLNPSNPFK